MLKYKNLGNDKFESEGMTSVDDQGIRIADDEKWLMDLLNEDVNDASHGWRQAVESNPADGFIAKVYQKSLPGKKLNVVKIQAVMKDTDKSVFKYFGENFKKYQKRYDMYNNQLDYRILKDEQSDDGKYIEAVHYTRSKLGAMASDRESILKLSTTKHDDGKLITIISPTEHEDAPKDTGAVRMEFFAGTIWDQVGNDIHMNGVSQLDLKGYFPTMMMNQILAKSCMDRHRVTMNILREIKQEQSQ